MKPLTPNGIRIVLGVLLVVALASGASAIASHQSKTALQATVEAQQQLLVEAKNREDAAALALTKLRAGDAVTTASLRDGNEHLKGVIGAFARQAAACEEVKQKLALTKDHS